MNGIEFQILEFDHSSFIETEQLISDAIRQRSNPFDRWEYWEVSKDGVFNFEKKTKLINSRMKSKWEKWENLSPDERIKFSRYVVLMLKAENPSDMNGEEQTELMELFRWTCEMDLNYGDYPDGEL